MQRRTYVYFISGAGLTKIGWTTNVQARLKTLQAHSPVRLTLDYAIPGDQELESAVHQQLRGVRRHGEWFAIPNNLSPAKIVASTGWRNGRFH